MCDKKPHCTITSHVEALLYRFLHLCEQYSLLPAEARIQQTIDPQTKREFKIQRFQKEKLAQARLKVLDISAGDKGDKDDNESAKDEDIEREAWLLKIELAILRAVEQSSQVKQVGLPFSQESTCCFVSLPIPYAATSDGEL